MSQLLRLAKPGDLERLLPMVAACHAAVNVGHSDDEHRRAAVLPLLEGSPHGAIWLVGPKMAPVGYVAVGFGWSIEFGGFDATIDEFWIREKVRGRGMGSEALAALKSTLAEAGIRALHVEVAPDNDRAQRLYRRLGFEARRFGLMTCQA